MTSEVLGPKDRKDLNKNFQLFWPFLQLFLFSLTFQLNLFPKDICWPPQFMEKTQVAFNKPEKSQNQVLWCCLKQLNWSGLLSFHP